jgi:hypothetical protein
MLFGRIEVLATGDQLCTATQAVAFESDLLVPNEVMGRARLATKPSYER